MTIRIKCDECGSVLKIKDELAGTEGKCPKCKRKFVVPAANAEPVKAAKATSAEPPAAKKTADDEFDLDAFMEEEMVAPPPPTAAPADAGGTSRSGRKRIVPATPDDDTPAAAAAASAALGASANARDLLSKNMDDSRVRAASLPEEEPRSPMIDFSGARQEIKTALPYIIGVPVLVLGLYWMMNSMMSSGSEIPELAQVSGTVTLDGKPFANVIVNLTPVDKKGVSVSGKEIKLRNASGVTDEDGFFRLDYMEGVSGAAVGKGRIWLQPLYAKDFSKIPPKYADISNDIREVREAGNEGKFDLEITTEK